MSKQELKALKEQMLLNILGAKGIYYTHYKNKQNYRQFYPKGKKEKIYRKESE